MRVGFAGVFSLFLVLCSNAAALPPIEAYGHLPTISSMAISPDGTKIAYVINETGSDLFVVVDLKEGPIFALDTSEFNARDVRFVNDQYVILQAAEIDLVGGVFGLRIEYTSAFAINIEEQQANQLLRYADQLRTLQSGLGYIVGTTDQVDKIFMPAFTRDSFAGSLDLLRADMDNGRASTAMRGNESSVDWVVTKNGKILAREDYNFDRGEYEIHSRMSGSFKKIYAQKNFNRLPLKIIGVKPELSKLLLVPDNPESEYRSLLEMDFEGNLAGDAFAKMDAGVEGVISNLNRIVDGVSYGGLLPSYQFFDKALEADVTKAQGAFSGSAVYLQSWTDDFTKLLFFVTGGRTSGLYVLYERKSGKFTRLAEARPQVSEEFVAPYEVINVIARDGLEFPSIVHWPLNVSAEERKNLPLIVIPHAGPRSYDRTEFNWMAQYFASRGYLVVQPNYRGSEGFGKKHLNAGRGEWGGKMQNDITDAVMALMSTGRADPERVCIIGRGYGGYTALAGGAFTPQLYSCVAAIAPATDLSRIIIDEQENYRSGYHWIGRYREEIEGTRREQRKQLDSISPVKHAAGFVAPVLLIHAENDRVVPFSQSVKMRRALTRNDKEVILKKLRGQDHSLQVGESRLETLKFLDAFITEHLGPAM